MDKEQICPLLSWRILNGVGRAEIVRNDRTAEKEVC